MSLYVLDTDHLSLLRYGHEQITKRVEAVPFDELAVTIVTIEEQLRSWYTQIRKARDADALARAYEGLLQVAECSKTVRVLPFTKPAVERYLDLRKQLPRLGKLDLCIAAIVLENRAVVVTRNKQDFEQVPNLQIEDWTEPASDE